MRITRQTLTELLALHDTRAGYKSMDYYQSYILYGVLILGLTLQISDKFFPTKTPPIIQTLRHYTGIMISAACIAAVILCMHFNIVANIITIIAIMPLALITYQAINNRYTAPILCAFSFLIGGFMVGFLSISGTSLLALHNGYPQPLLTITMFLFLAIPIALLLPRSSKSFAQNPKRSRAVFLTSILGVFFMWFAFSQFVYLRADKLAHPNAACVMETDGGKHQWSLLLSTRKLFLENTYKSTRIAYLRAQDRHGDFNHHWSFWAMNFVPDETDAFNMSSSFQRTKQLNNPCDNLQSAQGS